MLGVFTTITFLIILTIVITIPLLAQYLKRMKITTDLAGKIKVDLIFRDLKER